MLSLSMPGTLKNISEKKTDEADAEWLMLLHTYGLLWASFQPENEARKVRNLGVLYLDYFPRASKRGGAWCGQYRRQTYKDGQKVAPVVTIVCNFTKPAAGQPALLTADEASTMFHEFGHALHNLFRNVRYYGTSGVARDFVELPSQINEHWTFEPEMLKEYAKHYETGEVIPTELVDRLTECGKYGQGFATTEYLAASLLDMDFHTLKQIPEGFNVVDFEQQTSASADCSSRFYCFLLLFCFCHLSWNSCMSDVMFGNILS